MNKIIKQEVGNVCVEVSALPGHILIGQKFCGPVRIEVKKIPELIKAIKSIEAYLAEKEDE